MHSATLHTKRNDQHQVEIRAENLPCGEYYYTMEAQGYIQIRKMKLIK